MSYKHLIVSGIALFLFWPIAGIMTAFAFDDPTVSAPVEFIRSLLAITWYAWPIIWLASLVLWIVERRTKDRKEWKDRYVIYTYTSGGIHAFVWFFAFIGMTR